jgi:uncharacterized protein (TIGR04255 family)
MTMQVHSFPKRINPCPIAEATVELRFTTAVLPEAVFGIIYQEFRKDFSGKVEKLPILQLPEPIRAVDPNLMYQPHYKLAAGNLTFQIGPRVTSLTNFKEYIGWENFDRKLKEVFLRLERLQVVKAVERLGIRYVNLFKEDVYNNINLTVLMNDEPLKTVRTTLRAEIEEDGFRSILQIANGATIKVQSHAMMVGSVIDIEVGRQVSETNFFANMESILEKGHYIEKKLFFNLLKREFLSTLNPEY